MLRLEGISKSFGGLQVTNNVSMNIAAGERRVLLGPNGAGKTTLFNLITADIIADKGTFFLNGDDISMLSTPKRTLAGIARSFQKNNLFENLTVTENIGFAVTVQQNKASTFWRDTYNLTDVIIAIEEIANIVGLNDVMHSSVSALSYGVRRQVELALALACKPKLLLLDEPTSGISPDQTQAFQKIIQNLPRDISMLIIEHDMDLAFEIADSITVLDAGAVVFDGTPEAAKESTLLKRIYLGEEDV